MNYILAKLYKGKKEWYAYYSVRNNKGELVRCKERAGINRIKNLKQRAIEGNALVYEINKRLLQGQVPKTIGEGISVIATLKETVLQLLETKRPPNTDSETFRKYSYRVTHFNAWLDKKGLGNIYPGEFTPAEAHQYCDYLTNERKYSGKTFNVTKENLSSYFNMMVTREIITRNPFTTIKRRREVDSIHVAFTEEQLIEICQYLEVNDPDMLFFFEHISHCLIRRVEALRLKKPQYNLQSGLITVYGIGGKNGRQQIKEIPDCFIEKVKDYYKWNEIPEEWYVFGKGLKPGPQPEKPNTVTTRFTKMLRKLEYGKEYTLYAGKHTGAIAAFMAGVNIWDIMTQMGHSTINQTQKYMRSMAIIRKSEFKSKKPALISPKIEYTTKKPAF